jgi:hypothetical protein
MSKDIKIGNFGAISSNVDAKEGFWLVKWVGNPYQLVQESKVEGCGDKIMPANTWVCRGIFYNRIDHAPGWYELVRPSDTHLFWLQHVIHHDVEPERYNPHRVPEPHVPPAAANRNYNRGWATADVEYIPPNMRLIILRNKARLSKWDYHLLNGEVDEVTVQPEDPRKKERINEQGFIDYNSDQEEEEKEEEEEGEDDTDKQEEEEEEEE